MTVTEVQPAHALPVREHRRLCLYDHQAALRQLVTGLRRPATVDVADIALALVDLA
jgi:hypothetical protein